MEQYIRAAVRVKLTSCIRSDAISKRTCLLCVLMTD